jgi:CyaY protein
LEAGVGVPTGFVASGFGVSGMVWAAAAAGLAGKYSGPVWPQAAKRLTNDTAIEIAKKCFKFRNDFTIRITGYENFSECSMTESEFVTLAEATLDQIEASLEQAATVSDVDIECSRTGNVLEIEFVDNGSKIIINSQTPMQELWIAAKSGGFHYRREGIQWINTRDGSELFAALSSMVSAQSGRALVLHSDDGS